MLHMLLPASRMCSTRGAALLLTLVADVRIQNSEDLGPSRHNVIAGLVLSQGVPWQGKLDPECRPA